MTGWNAMSKGKNRLGNLRIRRQMHLLVGVAFAGFLAIALSAGLVLARLASLQDVERQAVATVRVADEVKYEFLNARRREKDFLIRLDEKYVKEHAEVVGRFVAGLDKLADSPGSEGIPALVGEVRSGFQAYVGQFAKVVDLWRRAGLNESKGLHGALRGSVHAIEASLKAADAKELTILMLMMRRHEKDFLARLDAKYVDEMKARAGEFETALAADARLSQDDKSGIREKMAAYQRDFNALAPLRLQIESEVGTLSKLFADAEPKLNALLGDLAAAAERVQTAVAEERRRAIFVLIGMLVLASAIVLGIAQLIGGGISRAVSGMASAMKQLASRDMSVEIPARGWRNEMGDMAAAVEVFKNGLIEADRLAEEQRHQEEARAARARHIEDLCKAFDAVSSETVKAVASAAAEMQSSSEAMNATAEEATRQASAVAVASEQASANVQTVASAAEELSSSIAEISRQVSQASQIASAAVSEAEQTNLKVQGLAQAAQKIGEVVALITDIAEQTNLLALNATIEAARAGEAGKGFAVVASEVKNLANQTARATDEIGAQIAAIQSATQEAVTAIEGIGKTIAEIDEVAAGVASAVEEQGAATQEIARNVEQAAAGTQEVSSNIAGVSQAANDTGSAAGQIHTAATELSRQSELLRTEVDKFLTDVRAA